MPLLQRLRHMGFKFSAFSRVLLICKELYNRVEAEPMTPRAIREGYFSNNPVASTLSIA